MSFSPRRSRAAVSALFFLSGLCFASWASRIPDIRLQLGLSEGQLGQLLLAMPLGSLLALPLAGWLTDTYGSRRVVQLASALYALSLPLLGWAPTTWTLAGALVLFGSAGNLLNISVNAQALEVQKSYGTSVIMGSFHGLWSLAGFVGGVVATPLRNWHQPPLIHFAGVSAALLVLLLAVRGGLPKPTGHASGTGFVLRMPDGLLLRLGLIALFGLLCEGCMFDWSGVYFQKVVQADKAWVTSGYVAFMSTMALGRFGSDLLTSHLGVARVLQLSSALICLGLLTAVLFPSLPTALLGFLLVGFGTSSVIPLTYSAAGRVKGISPGVALALVSTVGFFGFLAGPPLIGLLAQLFNLRLSFAFVALMGAAIGLLAIGMPSQEEEPTPLEPAPEPLAETAAPGLLPK
ncbi:MFS transporter [Hymenobacter guriensis]|uniref:MFS transporter n=1 Tax=Hymenobacter guriensis TaxID=2793065 RepID=A0ABS0KVQ8_9BACT|nr:MFS transporter [Hymenobacter guriensis]MBG8551915.1 MFS transporter [Hymenobacter guriensis]